MKAWLSLLRPGDWLILFAAATAVVALFFLLWRGGSASVAEIRQDGRLLARFPLTERRLFTVRGPLGETVIEIAPGRARVRSDPGPRQYCVAQGWLTRPHAVAICAPNRVSLTLSGPDSHDSLVY